MQRDRPLQYSMFLPDSNNIKNKKIPIPMEYNFPLPNTRKVATGYTNNQPHHPYQNMVQQNRPIIQSSNVEQLNHVSRGSQNSLQEIYEKLDKLAKVVEKHEIQLNSLTPQEELLKFIMTEIKKKFPPFTNANDGHDLFSAQKVQIKQLQDQISRIPKLNEIEQIVKKEIMPLRKLSDSNSINNINKPNEINPFLSNMLKKRDEFFQNIIANVETQVSIIKKNLSNIQIQMKVSPILSNSCIILKYQELLKARNNTENDIILSESTYYIDNEGHLLDCHSRYIVDQKGKKIKLEEKHLALLRNQKILQ